MNEKPLNSHLEDIKTDLNRELKSSIFTEEQHSRIDAFNEGFDDAYDLEPCIPLSDIPECREAYFQGYAGGMESWMKNEYPDIHRRSK